MIFIALWSFINRSFQILQSFQLLSRFMFWFSPMVMNLEIALSQVQVAEMGFSRRVYAVTSRDQVHICEMRKAWMSSHVFFEVQK